MIQVLLGIDVGTSGAKVVATDIHGRRIADAIVRYPTATAGQSAEQDAAVWWQAVVQAAGPVVRGHQVIAVAVTSQAPTLVSVDDVGVPTAPALTWLDRRGLDEARRIADLVPGSRNGADPYFGTAKLPWLARHRPAALAQAAQVLSCNGFIVRRLTGRAVMDVTTASLMQGFDESAGDFFDVLRREEPSLRYLPEIVDPHELVGTVTAEAAAATGIAEGTPVFAGGIDAVGSALEAGALAVGDPLVEMTGFSTVTMLAVSRGVTVPGYLHARHCVPGIDLLITAQVTAGATIDWVNGLDSARDLRNDEVLLTRPRPGRITMVPSLAGERTPTWNIDARGIIDGIDLATDSFDLMLAAMEGNALALAQDVEAMRAHGYVINEVISTGGGANSNAWLSVKADVLGVPVHRPTSGHGAAHGAALLAGVAVGTIDGYQTLRSRAREIDASFTPDHSRVSAYRDARARFTELAELNTTRVVGRV